MGTNRSKQKRENLLNKNKEILAFISAAPQDENTGNLPPFCINLERQVPFVRQQQKTELLRLRFRCKLQKTSPFSPGFPHTGGKRFSFPSR